MADLAFAYRKTVAGVEELTAKRCGLTREQRTLLIVADGRHALAAYGRVLGGEPDRLAALADSLLVLGLIASADDPALGAGTAGAPESTGLPDALALGRRLMALAASVFGDQAGPVLGRLEKAGGSLDALKTAVDQAGKLAKLTIDAEQAGSFLAEARKLLETS